MPDRYVNQTRPSLLAECKVSDKAATLMRVCERVSWPTAASGSR